MDKLVRCNLEDLTVHNLTCLIDILSLFLSPDHRFLNKASKDPTVTKKALSDKLVNNMVLDHFFLTFGNLWSIDFSFLCPCRMFLNMLTIHASFAKLLEEALLELINFEHDLRWFHTAHTKLFSRW